jgi:hypothetical protein
LAPLCFAESSTIFAVASRKSTAGEKRGKEKEKGEREKGEGKRAITD